MKTFKSMAVAVMIASLPVAAMATPTVKSQDLADKHHRRHVRSLPTSRAYGVCREPSQQGQGLQAHRQLHGHLEAGGRAQRFAWTANTTGHPGRLPDHD